uniref:Nuclear factor of activated T cells 5 n=1 Tax=Macaca fascicularis TaxID=9541 RepID=A0A7N9D6D7_MACFA
KPQRVGGCPGDDTPAPCETLGQPGPSIAGLWGPSPARGDTSLAPALSPALGSARGWPPQARRHQVVANTFSLPGAPARGHLPASLPLWQRGPSPAREQQPGQRRQEARALLLLFPGAPPRPPGPPRLFRAPGRPPPRLRRAPRGRGSDSCQRRRRWRRPSVFAEEKHETDPLALSLPLPRPEPSPGHRESVPVEFTLHLAIVSSVLGPVEVTTLEEEAAAAALASSPPVRCPRSRRGGAAATAAPPSRCPRAGLGRAAMPSDFISLLSADLDLESPKSLYSRDSLKLHPSQNFHRAGLLEDDSLTPQASKQFLKLGTVADTESVYDLLPKELQLPPSRETSVASMSQTSGGEAGSPPPAVVAAVYLRKISQDKLH